MRLLYFFNLCGCQFGAWSGGQEKSEGRFVHHLILEVVEFRANQPEIKVRTKLLVRKKNRDGHTVRRFAEIRRKR